MPLKVTRLLVVTGRRMTTQGLRITARHAQGAKVAGGKVTILRQLGCRQQTTFAVKRFDKRGRVTVTLPFATPPDTIAVYRATSPVGRTYSLPLAVRR